MEITFEEGDGNGVVAHVTGRIDTQTAAQFEASLSPKVTSSAWLVADLAEVNYVSSAGLRSVLVLAQTAQHDDCRLALCGLSADVYGIFEITGFQNIVPIHADVSAALAALG
ncbi:MAG: STAS domain-containing protein [Pseudomonadota bacterium]